MADQAKSEPTPQPVSESHANTAPSTETATAPGDKSAQFEQFAQEEQMSLLYEFLDFLVHNKKWWLTPIIIVILLVGLLVWFSGTAVAPFIYPM